jgi:hypothetical protein
MKYAEFKQELFEKVGTEAVLNFQKQAMIVMKESEYCNTLDDVTASFHDETAAEVLMGAFIFSDSLMGLKYWRNVHQQLKFGQS